MATITQATQVETRLQEMGRELPEAPTPAADYIPWRIAGDMIYIAGQVPMAGGKVVRKGIVGADCSVADAQDLAGICALNGIAQIRNAVASVGRTLDDVRIVKLGVFVAAARGFHEAHLVANGASAVYAGGFGDDLGRHARSAVGVHELPLGVPVEVECIAQLL